MKIFLIGGVTEPRGTQKFNDELAILSSTCQSLGGVLASSGHELILCSPFNDSVDYHVAKGLADIQRAKVEIHYPETPVVSGEVRKLLSDLVNVDAKRIPCKHVDSPESEVNIQYSWLFAQLNALDSCAGVVAVGGKPTGAARMLFQLAVSKNKSILPLTFLGGAASDYCDTYHWDLYDVLGKDLEFVTDSAHINRVPELLEKLIEGVPTREEHRFFISYARARPQEADYVETLIRRRNGVVYRDEQDFEPAAETQYEIVKNIRKSNVFVAIWCKEYACSPWCFDELELAIQRKKEGLAELWIFCVDDTRMVPRGAREMNYYSVSDRESLEAKVLHLMNRLDKVGVN